MKKTKFTEEQIALALHKVDSRLSIEEVCRKLGIGHATFYRWRQKYGGLLPSEVRKLKKLVADLSLDKMMLQDVLGKKE